MLLSILLAPLVGRTALAAEEDVFALTKETRQEFAEALITTYGQPTKSPLELTPLTGEQGPRILAPSFFPKRQGSQFLQGADGAPTLISIIEDSSRSEPAKTFLQIATTASSRIVGVDNPLVLSRSSPTEILCLTARRQLVKITPSEDADSIEPWLDLAPIEAALGEVHSFDRVDRDQIAALTDSYFVLIRRLRSREAKVISKVPFSSIYPNLQAMDSLIAGSLGAWVVGAVYETKQSGSRKPFLPLHAKDIRLLYLPYQGGLVSSGISLIPFRVNYTLLSVDDADRLYFQVGTHYAWTSPGESTWTVQHTDLFSGYTTNGPIHFSSQARFLSTQRRWPWEDGHSRLPKEPPRVEQTPSTSRSRPGCPQTLLGT